MSAAADRFHTLVTRLESEGHHLADEARDLYHHFVGHGPDTPTPVAPAEPQPVEPPAAA